MADFIRNYAAFVVQPFQDTTVTGFQVFPGFFNLIMMYTVAFSALYQVLPYILSSIWPKWYTDLEPIKRKEMPTYLISFVHHFIIVPVGWLHIYQDYFLLQSGVPISNDHYALKESSLVPLGCAFLLADIIYSALSEACRGRPLYLIHHILIIILGKFLCITRLRGNWNTSSLSVNEERREYHIEAIALLYVHL